VLRPMLTRIERVKRPGRAWLTVLAVGPRALAGRANGNNINLNGGLWRDVPVS
jgi:hypothetical protein